MISIEFRLDRSIEEMLYADFFNRTNTQRSPKFLLILAFYILAGGTFTFFILPNTVNAITRLSFGVLLVLLATGLAKLMRVSLFPSWSELAFDSFLKLNEQWRSSYDRNSIAIDNSGVAYSIGPMHFRAAWEEVCQIHADQRCCVIILSREDLDFMAIPSSAFDSAELYWSFVEEIDRKHRAQRVPDRVSRHINCDACGHDLFGALDCCTECSAPIPIMWHRIQENSTRTENDQAKS